MVGSDQDKKGKRKVTKIETFPVPFALKKDEKNITLITKTASKPSKEQIINRACTLHAQGNIAQAVSLYKKIINLGIKDHRVFSNYGLILSNVGKSKEAEIYARKAIEVNPNLADTHLNLGTILIDLGKLDEAELSTRKAIQINPHFANAHLNLGIILKNLCKLDEAELSTRKAIQINPHFTDAHSHLGNILTTLGKSKEAFDCYINLIEIDPTFPDIYEIITRFIRNSNVSLLNQSQLKNILNLLLERNDIAHNELFIAFNFLYSKEIINNIERFKSNLFKENLYELLINNKVLINALKKITFKDIKLERVLTNIRKYICIQIAHNNKIGHSQLEFIIALGEQCFLNEYIYSLTEEENICINIILNKCIHKELNETHISILSCYFPLYKLLDKVPSLKSLNTSNKNFQKLIKLQILEPLKEIELSKKIRRLGSINDNISKKVKAQYEENPYPRWISGNLSKNHKFTISQAINNEIKPNSISKNINNEQVKVLIAGCGTGNQILQAQRYKNAKITGIDLSISSLSYAKRKINELEIDNVELVQMDILDSHLLGERFDIIECSGVLHHMADPSKGLKTLLYILKNNGFLKLGLYSELARKHIVEARDYISIKKFESSEDNIRKFRESIFSGKVSKINSLVESPDFYTLSSCRDLCFHSQEHRFTIQQIEDTLESNGLEFFGFLLHQPIKSLYKKYFPEDQKQTNLQNWAKFEEKYPNSFSRMYQFWVCKTKI